MPLQTNDILLNDIKHNSVNVNDGSRNGKEGAVEAVEHPAMTGQDIPRILDAEFAFEQRFYKVAPCAEHNDNHRKSCP